MDRTAFENLYAAEYPRLAAQLTVLCGEAEEAADCVQEAFVRAWERRADLALDRAPGGWVRTTAVRIATSRWRRMRSGLRAVERLAARPQPQPDEPDGMDAQTMRLLRDLPADQRHAVVLHYVMDMAVADIAGLLGVPEGTVKTRLHRARAVLASGLAPENDGRSVRA